MNAYRRAAATLRGLATPVAEILERKGRSGLVELPDIGDGIAGAIEEMVRTGHWSLLDRLRGTIAPERLLQTVPGIGPVLAERIHDRLHVDSLEGLEAAAHDGRLETVPGVGPRTAAAIRGYLGDRFAKSQRSGRPRGVAGPGVAILLELDRAYREQAAAGELPQIAPRRFNPERRPWLPIGHYQRVGWHFTMLFSNTALAHRLDRTQDWVVIFFYDHDHREGQHTVVTETRGPLRGLRVVRGRENECREHYERAGASGRREGGSERWRPTAGRARTDGRGRPRPPGPYR